MYAYDPNYKMRIVIDDSLPPGSQIAQALHAQREFIEQHPDLDRYWYELSNSVVALNASSAQLLELIERCKKKDVRYSVFLEPDLNDQLTAVAIEPTRAGRKVTSNFRLALRDLT